MTLFIVLLYQQSHVTITNFSINTHASHNMAPSFIMKPISSEKCATIVSLLRAQYPVREIASSMHVSIGTVSSIRSKHCPDAPKLSAGRPSKLSPTNIRHAIRLITSAKADTAVDVAKTLSTITNTLLSSQTVRRGLKTAGMKAVVKKKKPLLTKKHRKERLDFALAHQYWTIEDWKKVLWSDETKINRLGSDGRKWVWKKPGEALNDRLIEPTLKFGGGSLMMWGCMTWDGVGYACKIDGKMDKHLYVQILNEELQQTLDHYDKTAQDVIFQQDNDPKHKSYLARDWFEDHNLQVLLWPSNSPDLNPIEHLWEHLKRRLAAYEVVPGGILELWDRVQVEWDKIEKEVCQNLIESMPRRMEAVIKARGGHTKY